MTFNGPFSYSWYQTGISFQLNLMQGVSLQASSKLQSRIIDCTSNQRAGITNEITFKLLLSGHPHQAASNQSRDEGFLIVFTSILKRPAVFKQPLSISQRVAILIGIGLYLFSCQKYLMISCYLHEFLQCPSIMHVS